MQTQQIIDFLKAYNYDVRITHNARWIDQKCTCDVLSIIADCILEYTDYNINIEFSISDIWQSEYANQNVVAIFSKPSTDSVFARNEYDKFFSQPINLFAYSGILEFVSKKGTSNIFKINNLALLEFIAMRETNALKFLILYIEKVLIDSGIYNFFHIFLEYQDKETFRNLKDNFAQFTIQNTPINQDVECGRIFTKILNPLAFKYQKKGTRKGHLSKTIITFDELKYNRINWYDEYSNKDKLLTRQEHEQINFALQANAHYNIQKAKKVVRRYNDRFNNGLSEVKQQNENVKATQIHHIFPASEFPTISDFIENLIALTPNQHFSYAHPNNQTKYIDKDFQYICLLAKTNTIMNDLAQTYDFDNYKFVLNTGLNTKEFETIFDFVALIEKIDYFYSDFNTNKYQNFIKENRPNINFEKS
ncbi:restriction endonuclease [Helicobacter sp. MIT 21-1697]|uniref:restriction endonuclease n=1 Tax=Helicobacter sp. MIT 21-1697 TaxID=2993733 RepID=UPI00224ACFAC|nr:restriction endonuclease [Helicobacter sp. MIT 21-1697]MCX2717921.1 restriction endonuclease [Helicobacter sp. MIT 21-1697]